MSVNYWDEVANSPNLRRAVEKMLFHIEKARKELPHDEFVAFMEEFLDVIREEGKRRGLM